jgi:two-component system response regulator YesN
MKQSDKTDQKEFWDSLQSEIIISNQKLTDDDMKSLIEQSFMFSLFFRGCSNAEILKYQTILGIRDNAYIILAELSPMNKSKLTDLGIDDLSLYHHLKEILKNVNHTIGPLISNRLLILVSDDDRKTDEQAKAEGIALSHMIMNFISKKFKISSVFGIGTVQNMNCIFTSFFEALSCVQYCSRGDIIHIQDRLKVNSDHSFNYLEAEKHMLDAVRLHKTEAYDYLTLMMEWIRPMNDETKRNKILETLALVSYTIRIDNPNEGSFNYMSHVKELSEASGDKLIEWAYQCFACITGFVRPQSSIDYSNKVVQVTKEFLENHYTEDITLEVLAEQVNISPQYFSKLIKKTTGFNFTDWLSMLRVKRAKELLTNSNLTVKEVCFMVGYKDPNYFSRIFKKRIGITPSEYVKTCNYQQ